jgi:catechol 2,3-dioxygenase-like lactoylglutathione lyase family enzyme
MELFVEDMDASVGFYTDVLGSRMVTRHGRGVHALG